MRYTYNYGVTREGLSKLSLLLIAIAFAFTAVMGVITQTRALSPTGDVQFTQDELDNKWEADRQFPTDDVTSVSEHGRDNVARIGVDSDETENNTFRRTEGIKTIVDAYDLGNTVQVDLYVDPDWQDKAVRAGVWVVGDNGDGARDNLFGIIEFVNLETSTTGESATGDHEGWRWWTSATGWTNLDATEAPFTYGEWATLKIELDAGEYKFSVDGDQVATGPGGVNSIHEAFLNSYNYGLDEFPNLNNTSYAAHWHGGLVEAAQPQTKDECKKGGFADFGFKNQGLCVQFVNTNKDSRDQ